MPCSVQCMCANTRGGGCGQAVCKEPHAHGVGTEAEACATGHHGKESDGPTPQPHTDPWGLQQPESHPTVRKDNVPWSGGPPRTPGRRRLCVPIGWPAGSVGGGAASTGGCAIPWTCGGGRSGGCSPEPCGAHAGAHSTLGACTRMCAAMGMQGSTARATLLPGPCSLHSVPGSPGTGMHEGLGGGCPCWEVMRGAGATGS